MAEKTVNSAGLIGPEKTSPANLPDIGSVDTQGTSLGSELSNPFTVSGNGRAIGTTPERAIKTTYSSDMKNMW